MFAPINRRRYLPMLALSVAVFTSAALVGPVFVDPGHQPAQLALAQAGDSDSSSSTDSSSSDSTDSAGTVRVNNYANLEALLNICGNGLEIWGISSSGSFFVGAIVSFVMRHYILGGLLLFLTPGSFIGGLAAPGVINWIVASARDANTPEVMGALAIVVAIGFFTTMMAIGFTPTAIAFARRHPQKWLILLSTFVSWLIPLGWPALLFWAYYDRQPQGATSA